MHDDASFQWPKPSPVPWYSVVLLLINAGLVYLVLSFHVSWGWAAPTLVLNLFFFWAERDIYVREKRNFDDWTHEMARILAPREDNSSWSQRISSMRKRRRHTAENTSEPRTIP